jgi:membrane-bound serine protease (ClpP class)
VIIKWLCQLTLAVVAMLIALSSPLQSGAERHVQVLTVRGVINPLTTSYLKRALQRAEAEGAAAVVLQLDTPGGLEGAMREMTQAILNSPLPVVVYVAPAGARATSAGLFITLAAHVAAMAPGTNIGAAHPVTLGGEVEPAMVDKMVSDAAATARALAQQRGRDPNWAEKAVRESVSMTASEARARGVVDLIAPDLETLLEGIDGRTVETTQGKVTLSTRGAGVVAVPMNLIEQLLHVITDPNLAYLLLVLGMWALIIEFQEPGVLVPGISGAIMLVLAFAALGSLPLNWAGVAFLILAAILLVAELYEPDFGVLGVGSLVAFVLGSLLLFRPFVPPSPVMPAVEVNPWLVAATVGGMAALACLALGAGLRAQRIPALGGPGRLVGQRGWATTDLTPEGTVQVGGELWTATAEEVPIAAGEAVEVIAVERVKLRVRGRSVRRKGG